MPTWNKNSEEEIPLVDVDGVANNGTEPRIATTIIAVDGMTCGACTAALEGLCFRSTIPLLLLTGCVVPGGFEGVDGIESFTVSLMTERAVVVHDLSKVTPEQAAEMYGDPCLWCG